MQIVGCFITNVYICGSLKMGYMCLSIPRVVDEDHVFELISDHNQGKNL
jgi:hypothetical protein